MLDDIATVLDDIALMTKLAAKKTAGVLGDDLALNAQQVAGVASEREIPVVWAVAKGSLLNKAILIPAALLISAFAPALITPLLMLGGSYLCYEGAEKLLHRFLHRKDKHCAITDVENVPETANETTGKTENAAPIAAEECLNVADVAEFERQRVKGAVRTDFVLSAEIVVISLGTVPPDSPFAVRAAVLCFIGILMTVGVYGLVACIVKMDDAGAYLLRKHEAGRPYGHRVGHALVEASPKIMRLLGVVGTIAMFTVGGGILAHGIPPYHYVTDFLATLPWAGVWEFLAGAIFGVLAGAALAFVVGGIKRLVALGGQKANP